MGLLSSENKAELFDKVAVPVILTDWSGVIIYANTAAAEMAETAEQKLNGRIVDDAFGLYISDAHDALGKEQNTYVTSLCGKQGDPVRVEVSLKVLDSEAGKRIAFVLHDVSVWEQRGAELRERELLYRTLFERSTNPVFVIDAIGNFIDANNAALDFMQCSLNDLKTRNVRETLSPDTDVDKVMAQHRVLWKSGGSIETIVLVNGQKKIVDLSIIPAVWHEHEVVFGLARNVTDKRQTEQRLRESEEKYRLLVENSLQGILIFQDSTIAFANNMMEKISGHPVHELLGTNPFLLIHPEERQRAIRVALERLEGVDPDKPHEYRLVRKDGTIRWISIISKGVLYQGRPAVQSTLIDTSERKLAEDELHRYKNHLEELVGERTEELESFARSVAHDLRSPLRAMHGFADILLEDYAGSMDAEGQDYAHRIRNAALRMDLLIKDLLAYSHLARADIAIQKVSLADAVDSALLQLKEEIEGRSAEIIVASALPDVYAFQPVLVQVLVNLISNAIKFVNRDTRPRVVVSSRSSKSGIHMSIQDNGIGIAPEYQESVFEVFKRLHTIQEYPGTGIGLAIVKKGIERMGGEVGVMSSPGEGSTFWVTLPKA